MSETTPAPEEPLGAGPGRAPEIPGRPPGEPEDIPEIPGADEPPAEIDGAEFRAATGEDIGHILSLDSWRQGPDLAGVYERLERELAEAFDQEDDLRRSLRKTIFPLISSLAHAPPGAGVYQATPADIREVQEKALFNGGVEACDGTSTFCDTLPLTIVQIGVCLVSYAGEQGSWVQRIFRRDIRNRGKNPVDEAFEILQRRHRRAGLGRTGNKDVMSELLRRGLMTYSERAVLLEKSSAPWRLGHGQPAPYELLTGSGSMELLMTGLDVLRRLLLDHKRFVFVPSEPAERDLLTIGDALRPLEFAIVDPIGPRIHDVIHKGNLRGSYRDAALAFYRDAAPQIVVGVYRASRSVPPYIFYAHVDHAEEAALIAMADSVLQEHRGFPTLIDLADSACRSTFGGFDSTVQASYAASGRPLAYMRERQTRS
ncbi:MAG: hypothetical protein ACREON_12215 [Gemmatimonadaceae bacterium]